MRPPSTLLLHSLRCASRKPLRPILTASQIPPQQHRQSSSSPQPPRKDSIISFPSRPSKKTASKKPAQPAQPAPPSDHPNIQRPPPEPRLQSSETTTTDFEALNVLGNATPPSNSIETCLEDGFILDNGLHIMDGAGILLVQGEAFNWRPWETMSGKLNGMINGKGQFELSRESWGVLDVVWPKPELLILGLGKNIYPLSPETRRHICDLGIRVDVQDTRNAAAEFNLLATERGVREVAAALIPLGWKGKR